MCLETTEMRKRSLVADSLHTKKLLYCTHCKNKVFSEEKICKLIQYIKKPNQITVILQKLDIIKGELCNQHSYHTTKFL
jgi:flagellar biosynthesis/type III secretory pathway chaperone